LPTEEKIQYYLRIDRNVNTLTWQIDQAQDFSPVLEDYGWRQMGGENNLLANIKD
jgi:hypothetical protein